MRNDHNSSRNEIETLDYAEVPHRSHVARWIALGVALALIVLFALVAARTANNSPANMSRVRVPLIAPAPLAIPPTAPAAR